MIFLKKILKLILPKKFVKYLRGRLNHDGYLLFLFPPLKFFSNFFQKNILKSYLNLGFLVTTMFIITLYIEKKGRR